MGKRQFHVIGPDRLMYSQTGSDGPDDIAGFYDQVNYLDGRGGNDTISSGQFGDFLIGGTGDDVISAGSGDDSIYDGDGLRARDDGSDTIYAASGDDLIFSNGGLDYIDGDAGDDTITFFDGCVVDGGTGDDLFKAFSYQNQLDTAIYGGTGDDILQHEGDDTFALYRFYGDQGEDTISYELYDASGVTIDLTAGFASANGTTTDGVSLWRVEDAIGTFNDDVLIGEGGVNALEGRGGNDVIAGRFGGDWLDGGDGIDTLDYSKSNAAVRLDLSTGNLAGGDAEGDHIANFERYQGSAYADTMTGNSFGAETFLGLGGNDVINANKGIDVLDGGDGNDRLAGGGFTDTLTGGAGRDLFIYVAAFDAPVGGTSYDEITDLSRTDRDKIDLHLIDADAAVAGDQAFRFIGTKPFDGGHGELRVDYSFAGHATVLIDVNGDKTADMALWLDGFSASQPVRAGDFLL